MIGQVQSECSVASHQLRLAAALVGGRYDDTIPRSMMRRTAEARTSAAVDFGTPLRDTVQALLFLADVGSGLLTGNPMADTIIRATAFMYAGLEPRDDPDSAGEVWNYAGELLVRGRGVPVRALAIGDENKGGRRTLLDAVLFPIVWRCWWLHRADKFQMPSTRGTEAVTAWLKEMKGDKTVMDSMRDDEWVYFSK